MDSGPLKIIQKHLRGLRVISELLFIQFDQREGSSFEFQWHKQLQARVLHSGGVRLCISSSIRRSYLETRRLACCEVTRAAEWRVCAYTRAHRIWSNISIGYIQPPYQLILPGHLLRSRNSAKPTAVVFAANVVENSKHQPVDNRSRQAWAADDVLRTDRNWFYGQRVSKHRKFSERTINNDAIGRSGKWSMRQQGFSEATTSKGTVFRSVVRSGISCHVTNHTAQLGLFKTNFAKAIRQMQYTAELGRLQMFDNRFLRTIARLGRCRRIRDETVRKRFSGCAPRTSIQKYIQHHKLHWFGWKSQAGTQRPGQKLNKYPAPLIPGPLAAEEIIQLSDAAINTDKVSLVDRLVTLKGSRQTPGLLATLSSPPVVQKTLKRAASIQKAYSRIRHPYGSALEKASLTWTERPKHAEQSALLSVTDDKGTAVNSTPKSQLLSLTGSDKRRQAAKTTDKSTTCVDLDMQTGKSLVHSADYADRGRLGCPHKLERKASAAKQAIFDSPTQKTAGWLEDAVLCEDKPLGSATKRTTSRCCHPAVRVSQRHLSDQMRRNAQETKQVQVCPKSLKNSKSSCRKRGTERATSSGGGTFPPQGKTSSAKDFSGMRIFPERVKLRPASVKDLSRTIVQNDHEPDAMLVPNKPARSRVSHKLLVASYGDILII
ncbi:hypothetical protein CLF_108697 [Clonorchis sinensis]|uniref:Uncharacterized protein n=1 Tax=Clonorchis sinensis TaxID=79923 RepID=G7YRU8_CLOSI|nr:hypothetical protein CLF_108697 [Clonorchis sinensis]